MSDLVREIFKERNIVIPPTSGGGSFYDACETFSHDGEVYEESFRRNLEEAGVTRRKPPATPETPVKIYEWVQKATLAQLFVSLSDDLFKICFTQPQIERFCREFCNDQEVLLTIGGKPTLFLFDSGGHFQVAQVYMYSVTDELPGDLSVESISCSSPRNYSPEEEPFLRKRIVVPKNPVISHGW